MYCVHTVDLYSGHMIGSSNTPFMDFFTSDTKTIKPVDQLKEGTNNIDDDGIHHDSLSLSSVPTSWC